MSDCPQCGEPTKRFREGYCEDCWAENQAALDEHIMAYDLWQSLDDAQRGAVIRKASQ